MIGKVVVKVVPRSNADVIEDARMLADHIREGNQALPCSFDADTVDELADRLEAADARLKAQQAQYRALEKELEASELFRFREDLAEQLKFATNKIVDCEIDEDDAGAEAWRGYCNALHWVGQRIAIRREIGREE